ncbi:MAG: Zn-ribbon domain-containing OB-fold protein [Proteobacteria bacterium]|nr:Zn-ribbon domain-containing OB-fold protein [Pseudomonadota bacterium]
MGFEKFGVVSHTKESKAADFVTYLEKGKVMAVSCKKCGAKYFPPQMDCPKCVHSETEWFEIKGRGKLVSYSIMNYGPSGFEDKAPYTLAVGEFEEGVKVFATLDRAIKEDEIKIGMPLKVVAVTLPGEKVSFELKAAG